MGVFRFLIGSHLGLLTYDAKDPDTSFPAVESVSPPEGAPNVLVILLDDVGFGAASAFGGPAQTPVAERLQAGGLTYTRFHTTSLCAPTRAALLSSNHHSVRMGSITESATAAPGLSGVRPNTKAALATTLKLNGYSTAQPMTRLLVRETGTELLDTRRGLLAGGAGRLGLSLPSTCEAST